LGMVDATVEPVLQVQANKAAPETYGVNSTTTFQLNVTDNGNPEVYDITLTQIDTLTNRSVYDLAADLNSAINSAFSSAGKTNPFVVTVQTGNLVVGLKTTGGGTSLFGDLIAAAQTIDGFSFSGAPAGLNLDTAADSADMIIETRD